MGEIPRRIDLLEQAISHGEHRPGPEFAVSPEEAQALLVAEATPAENAQFGEVTAGMLETDPLGFLDELEGKDWLWGVESGAPEEMAAYRKAEAEIAELLRFSMADSEPSPARNQHPLVRLDEAALALWCAAWMAGVRAGVQYEHLRLAMVTPRLSCGTCHGYGRLWDKKPYIRFGDVEVTICTDCMGVGTVPTPRAKLAVPHPGR